MVRYTAYVLLSVLGVILATDPWWVTGSPFKHTTTPRPLKWFISSDGRQRFCQCSQPHHCRDYITLKSSTDAIPTCQNGEVCCDSLKQTTAYDQEDSANGVIPTKFEEDVGGDEDSPEEEEDPDELYTDSGKESEDESPPTVIKKFTEDDEDVIDLDELVGSSEDKPEEFKCGIATSHLIIDDKQAADHTTRFAQYPWNLVILYEESGTTLASCGATLIEPSFAITAAHCMADKDVKRMTVRAGEWDLNEEDETFPHEDRTIKSIVIHERYQKFGLHNDIAFIELSTPFTLSPHIGKLCIPDKKELVRNPCIATGWGMRGDEVSPSKQSKMKAVEVTLEKATKCQEKLQQTDLGRNFRLSTTALCATALRKGEDTSIGDGGGPLFCKSLDGSHFTFVGIISWGKLKYPDAPGVYTAVKQYSDWMEEQMMKALGMFKSNT